MTSSEWTPGMETILNSIRINSLYLSELYKNRYIKLKGRLRYFKIPVIVLSSFNSVLSVGSDAFYLPTESVSIIVCILSLLCGIIGSVELFLSIQKQMESDLETSKSFYILSISIFKMLSLEPSHRNLDSKIFMEQSFSEYKKLIENSIVIEKKIIDQLFDMEKYMSDNIDKKFLLNDIESQEINDNKQEINDNKEENPNTSIILDSHEAI